MHCYCTIVSMLLCITAMNFIQCAVVISVTNGKHQLVPKEIAEAAEKHAKVCTP